MLKIIPRNVAVLTGPVMITLSGITEKNVILVSRTIKIFGDKGFNQFIADVTSATDGTWTANVPGGVGNKYTVIAIGEYGENDVVFADCQVP